MAESSSVHATSQILPIRPQQCLVIDLNPLAYDSYMSPIIECLKYSQIAPALSRIESVPMVLLSQVYATAYYDKAVERVFFEVADHKTSISKPPPSSKTTHTTEPPPTGQASGSGVKDKGKNIAEEEDEDEDKETIADMLKRKNSGNVDEDVNRVAREAEEAERKKKEAHDLLESRKTLFPAWTRERMIKEAIDTPSILWLEPVISFDCYNSVDSQLDMPLTRKAFIFHAFSNIYEVPHPNPEVDRELIDFYLKAARPQYLTWSTQKIVNVRVLKPYTEGRFINVRFKVIRGSAKSEHLITLADLPNLNPHDWIVLHNILLTNEAEYGPIIDHLKRMIVCYIMEVALMDQEVATVFKKKPKIAPVGSASDLNQMKNGQDRPETQFGHVH
ncbi:hypothetical protein Lser_V15G45863 [Lactuca serriola]